ncbi:MAG: glycosyltransferase [Sulfuricella denitrificans]|nr:glycosyltransferase [Sulfuricella denitrificans]
MRLIFNFRKGFAPLREGLEANGCEILDNLWEPGDAQLANIDACIINFYEGVRQPFRTWRLKSRLRKHGIPLIGIDRDAPWHLGVRHRRLWVFSLLRPLDIYATHTLQPTLSFAPENFYLANAAATRLYHLHGVALEEMRRPEFFSHDVSFVGNLDGQRYREHRARAEFFAELERRLAGSGINCMFRHAENLPVSEQVNLIQRSRINLNAYAAADHGGVKGWGLPERCYGVPACGGFLLSDERRHARDDFEPGVEWADFHDLEDCIARIHHYLAHPDESRTIAEAAYHRVMRDHTYEQRAASLLTAIAQWKERRGK